MGTHKLKEYFKYHKGVTKEWLIENLIPLGEVVILYAPTNQYKTFLSLKIALEVVTGSQELGVTKTGNVTIFSPDTASSDLILRIRGLATAKYQENKESILENLELNFDNDLDLTSEGWGTMEDSKWVKEEEYPFRTLEEEFERVATWKEQWDFVTLAERNGLDATLLIIDTLSQSIGASSINDDIAIRKAIKACKEIIEGNASMPAPMSILLIAHAGKDGSKGIMGSSIQKNDIPTVLKIRKRKGGQMELFREKMKCKAEGTAIPFKMREIVIDEQETLYVDIGSALSDLENHIVNRFQTGESKETIRDNTYKIFEQHYNSKKSFNVVFGRSWKSLSEKGFLKVRQQSNKEEEKNVAKST